MQISDYGYEVGGPILQDRAWFYHSYSTQDVRLVRRAGQLVDRTVIKNPNVKVNWQTTRRAMVSFLFFDGSKVKDGRSPGIAGILFEAPTATRHQDNAYAGNPFLGLWKIGGDVFNIMNANTALVRNNNITSPTFNALAQNLSPRILRLGASIGF